MTPAPDLAGLLMAEPIDAGAVRAAIGDLCQLPEEDAREVLADAWVRVCFAGDVDRWNYQTATLAMVDAVLRLPAGVRGIVSMFSFEQSRKG